MPLLVTSCEESLPMALARADEAQGALGLFGALAGGGPLPGAAPTAVARTRLYTPTVAAKIGPTVRPISLEPRF